MILRLSFFFLFSCSVHLTLCNPMDCRTPGFPVHHQVLELTQTHVHLISDAIQPSHPLSSPFLLPSIFLSIRVFSKELALHMWWSKYWSFSFSISPSNEWKWKSLSHVWIFETPWTIAHQAPLCPWNSPGKNTGVGCHFLLQRIFPTLGSNPGLPHCRQTL